MKKFSWILALLAALTMVFVGVGCGGGDGPPPVTGEMEEIFVLSEYLAEKYPTWSADVELNLYDKSAEADALGPYLMGGLGNAATGPTKVIVTEIGEGTDKTLALKVGPTAEDWGQGIDLQHAAFNFRAGDKITVTASLVTGAGKVSLTAPGEDGNNAAEELTAEGVTVSRTLTSGNVSTISGGTPKALRIKGAANALTFTIEEIVIERPKANATPTADDYVVSNLYQKTGEVTAVKITSGTGAPLPAATSVFYAGSATVPQVKGKYAITFNTPAATGYNAANGIAGGTLFVVDNFDALVIDTGIEFTPSASMDETVAGDTFVFKGTNANTIISYAFTTAQKEYAFVKVDFTVAKEAGGENAKDMKWTVKDGAGDDIDYKQASSNGPQVIEFAVSKFGDGIKIAHNTWSQSGAIDSADYTITITKLTFFVPEPEVECGICGELPCECPDQGAVTQDGTAATVGGTWETGEPFAVTFNNPEMTGYGGLNGTGNKGQFLNTKTNGGKYNYTPGLKIAIPQFILDSIEEADSSNAVTYDTVTVVIAVERFAGLTDTKPMKLILGTNEWGGGTSVNKYGESNTNGDITLTITGGDFAGLTDVVSIRLNDDQNGSTSFTAIVKSIAYSGTAD